MKGLKDYIVLKAEADDLSELIERLKSNLEAKPAILSDTPASSGNSKNDKIGNCLAQIEELHKKLIESLKCTLKRISCIEEPKQRRVLYLKYIKGYKMSDIADNMNYSRAQVKRFLKDAINNF